MAKLPGAMGEAKRLVVDGRDELERVGLVVAGKRRARRRLLTHGQPELQAVAARGGRDVGHTQTHVVDLAELDHGAPETVSCSTL